MKIYQKKSYLLFLPDFLGISSKATLECRHLVTSLDIIWDRAAWTPPTITNIPYTGCKKEKVM